MGLKENQKTLYDNIELYFKSDNTNRDLETYTTTEKNGGRIEKKYAIRFLIYHGLRNVLHGHD